MLTTRSGCAINATVEALGDQWSLLVLRDITFGGNRYFRELLRGSQEGIASNVLAGRLARLVQAGLLTRQDAPRGQRVRYSLTEAAIQLVPVFVALGSWGLHHRDTTPHLAARAAVLAEGGPPMWERLMAELRQRHLRDHEPDAADSVLGVLAVAAGTAGAVGTESHALPPH